MLNTLKSNTYTISTYFFFATGFFLTAVFVAVFALTAALGAALTFGAGFVTVFALAPNLPLIGSGVASARATPSAQVNVLGSWSFGILIVFFPATMYGP